MNFGSNLLASFFLLTGAFHFAINCSGADAQDGTTDRGVVYITKLNIAIRSWEPGKVLGTYKNHSSGSCSHGGTVGIGVGGTNGFSADVRCVPVRDRVAAEISIKPYDSNKQTKASKSEVDLSDMRPEFIEIAKNDDGRVYFLIVEPEMIAVKPPKTFSVNEISPFDWDFPQSPVILNDTLYLGRVGMSGGSLVGISIAGIADLELSLQALKEAEPIGVLQAGTLTIKYGDDQIVVSGVRNGANKQTLEGPFKVWVRATENRVTGDEYKRQMSDALGAIRKRQAEGDISITDDIITKFEEFVKSGRPLLLGSSSRDAREEEIVK